MFFGGILIYSTGLVYRIYHCSRFYSKSSFLCEKLSEPQVRKERLKRTKKKAHPYRTMAFNPFTRANAKILPGTTVFSSSFPEKRFCSFIPSRLVKSLDTGILNKSFPCPLHPLHSLSLPSSTRYTSIPPPFRLYPFFLPLLPLPLSPFFPSFPRVSSPPPNESIP